MEKPAILMISNFLEDGRHNRNIWHALAMRLSENGWTVLTTSSQQKRVWRLMEMLWVIVYHRRRYDLAHIDVFSGKAFIFAEWCAGLLKLIRKPFILTLHGGRLPDFAQKNQRRVQTLLLKASAVVSPSYYQQNEFKHIRSDIIFIPNPINLSASIYRPRLSLKPKLIWVRAFHAVYDPEMAVEVVGNLRVSIPNIHLIMVGPDKGDGSLERVLTLAEKLDVIDHLTVIPGVPHSEIPALLDRADIFINTSNYDTAPQSILEAMANGLCVVSTNVGGIPYLVENQKDGLLVGQNQAVKMAEYIHKIILDQDLVEKLSLNARKKAEKYDWEVVLPQWEALFSLVYWNKNEQP